MKSLLLSFLTIIILSTSVFAQGTTPKREFRAAWVATVINLDWPSNNSQTVENQKQQLIDILDGCVSLNINAVIFQVRTECDALYDSNIDPWSYWLTGSQGSPPAPYYDPLEFAVTEAHKRGLEIHAWFNPYRAERSVGYYPLASNHVINEHPDWIIHVSSLKILDPGIPMVREYVTSVVMDVVRRYDVDGVHFDDYFYPYPEYGFTNQDQQTFNTWPNGFTNINDWRRDNVNRLMIMVNDSIKAEKPWVKFGVSPFGIWKYGVPPGIVGLSAYNDIYCDAIAWLQDQSIDYLTPQLYWSYGGGQDYGTLMHWWADSAGANGRHLYPGQAAYRISSFSPSEIPNQIRDNRATPNSLGSVFFRIHAGLLDNPKGFADTLRNDLYRNPALPPVMDWLDTQAPNQIQNLRFERIPGEGIASLQWDLPNPASDGDTASRYVIYEFDNAGVSPSDLDIADNINSISGGRAFNPLYSAPVGSDRYYVVTALDRNWNESTMSTVVQVTAPGQPSNVLPADGAADQPPVIDLKWNYADGAMTYRLQIASDAGFSNIVKEFDGITDTMYSVSGLSGEETYYWRVAAANVVNESNFSTPFSFTTGFPAAPELLSPPHAATELDTVVNFVWQDNPIADSYKLQVATSIDFPAQNIVIDEDNIVNNTFTIDGLDWNTIYFWRISGTNGAGTGLWSEPNGFKTNVASSFRETGEIPTEYALEQNFPNPFNPVTTIHFAIPEAGQCIVTVYDVRGSEVAVLVDEYLSAGSYSASFNGSELASGTYIYELQVNDQRFSKKMLLLK